MKRPPVVLTGPIPTVEEVAAISGMSRKRMLELIALADSISAELEKKAARERAARRAAAGKRTNRSAAKKAAR